MKLKRLNFFIFILFSIHFSCTSIKKLNYEVTEKKHTPEDLLKDVDLAYKLLTKGHPGIYWYIEKEQFDFKFDSLRKSLTAPLTTKEFYKKIAPVIAEVRCGHTRLILVTKRLKKKEKDSLNKLGKPISQFAYKVIDDKIYINAFNKKVNRARKGDEILAIDGVSSNQIVRSLVKNYASDGYNKTFKTAVLNRAFIAWYTAIYDNKDTLDFKIKKRDTVFNLTLTTIKKEEKKDSLKVKTPIKKLNKDSLLAKNKLEKEKRKLRYKGSDEIKKPLLDLQFLEKDSSVAYLKVKSFSFPFANFDRFYKESFEAIKNGKTKNVILDLRDNGGGSLRACRNLFSYFVAKEFIYLRDGEMDHKFNPYWYVKGVYNKLKAVPFELVNLLLLKKKDGKFSVQYTGIKPLPPNKNHYDGKLYVLINGYSFSASAILAANLKQINRATFVGQETGGGFNGCVAGNIPVLDLPHSKLKLRMGLYPVVPNAHTKTIGRGIFPDKEIITTIEDVITGNDKQLSWVLNNIKN